jgi:hypothetical protein
LLAGRPTKQTISALADRYLARAGGPVQHGVRANPFHKTPPT